MDQKRNQKGNQKYLERNKNWNTTYWNLWSAAKVILRGKFIGIQSYPRKQNKTKNSNEQPKLTPKITREEKTKPKVSIKNEIIKIRTQQI